MTDRKQLIPESNRVDQQDSYDSHSETSSVHHLPTHHHCFNPVPQNAPGSAAAIGHVLENSIPLSIFPIQIDKFVFCFSGLPGRGKTHISRRLASYLSFFYAVPVRVFNVAAYREKMHGGLKAAEWFDPHNEEALKIRNECNEAALRDIVTFLCSSLHGIAILDSTNATHARRAYVAKMMSLTGAKVMFIEVNNEDENFLSEHYRTTVHYSADYVGQSDAQSEADFRKKIEKYKALFEPLDSGAYSAVEKNWSYMKCDHSKKHFVVHNAKGHIQQKVVNFIMNLRTTSHPFYLSRHGQSEYNDLGRIGGDSGLTNHGVNYARKLAEFVDKKIVKDEKGEDVPARLWTSTMRRTKETAQFIQQNKIIVKGDADQYEWVQMRPKAWHHLDELFAGACDGMTYEEIEEKFPDEWELRSIDKLAYRYPRGESYLDVIARLEPIIIEMERHQEPLLIIGHQAVLRIIYAFYIGKSRAEAPYLSIPLNTVIELVPGPVTCKEQRYVLYNPANPLSIDGQDEPLGKPDDPPSH